MWGPCSRACMYKEKFFLLERQLFQKYHKNVPRKQGECIFSKEKPKSFQGPKVGPGPWPIKAHLICTTPLHSIGDFARKKFGPLTSILGPPLLYPEKFSSMKETIHTFRFPYDITWYDIMAKHSES